MNFTRQKTSDDDDDDNDDDDNDDNDDNDTDGDPVGAAVEAIWPEIEGDVVSLAQNCTPFGQIWNSVSSKVDGMYSESELIPKEKEQVKKEIKGKIKDLLRENECSTPSDNFAN